MQHEVTIFNIYVDKTLHITRVCTGSIVTMAGRTDRRRITCYAATEVIVEFEIFPPTIENDSRNDRKRTLLFKANQVAVFGVNDG